MFRVTSRAREAHATRKAIEAQTKVVDLVRGNAKKYHAATLEKYKAAKEKQ